MEINGDSQNDSTNHSVDYEEEIDINSPRLREACKRQGFEPQELLKKSISEIREKYKGERLNREGIMLIAQHYEERRIAKLKIVLKERNKIIEEQCDETWRLTQKGRTISYTPKKVTFKNLKEKQLLREMIVDQQREIDMLLLNGRNVKGGPISYQENVARQRAENAHFEFTRAAGAIEVIDENDFRGTKNKEKLYQQHKAGIQREAARNRRNKQKQIYASELRRFNETEEINRIKENRNTKYLSFLKRVKGSLFEHKYVWRERKDFTKLRRNPMLEYFEEVPKYNQQKYLESLKRDPVGYFAKTESRKWLQNNKDEFAEGMYDFNKKKEILTPAQIKKTLRQIETKPKNTREIVQELQAFNEKSYKRPETTKFEEDSSDDEWEVPYYAKSQTPVDNYTRSAMNRDMAEMKTSGFKNFRSTDQGFYSTNGSKSGTKYSDSGIFSRTAFSSNNKGREMTLSAGFAKSKLQNRENELFKKGMAISQRVTSSQSFYDKNTDDEDYEESGRDHQLEVKRALQGLKIEQDKEVMDLVYGEQRRELERKSTLSEVNDIKEKRYFNKVFAAEKDTYNSQLKKLLSSHDDVYNSMRSTLVSNS